MIATIHQPDFLPWLGFFNKAALCDVFVIADHVQYRDNGFQNRNRIKTPHGAQWLTVPVARQFGEPIFKVRVSTHRQGSKSWADLHILNIRRNYSRSPHFDKYFGIFEEIYRRGYEHLYEYNVAFIQAIFQMLGIHSKIAVTHDWGLKESKTQSVVEICKHVGADSYISGIRGVRYLDAGLLSSNGIRLLYNKYEHPVYTQLYMKLGFASNMSVIDLIFNHGPQSLEIIKSGFRGFELTAEEIQKLQEEDINRKSASAEFDDSAAEGNLA